MNALSSQTVQELVAEPKFTFKITEAPAVIDKIQEEVYTAVLPPLEHLLDISEYLWIAHVQKK